MSFWGELKRRNVFKVGAAYAVVAWLLAQIVSLGFQAYQMPQWTVTFVVSLLIVGFPLILLFAWAFEITPDGIKRTRHKAPDEVVETEVAPSVAKQTPAPVEVDDEKKEQKTIAVLPFADLSPEKDQEYFVDGLSEEILNSLCQIPKLGVTGRTSSFAFKGAGKTIQEIAEILSVNNILEGSVRKAGNHLRITAQLVRSSDGLHLWSKTYDREFKDIFAVQEDIATAVANELRVKLGIGKTFKQLGGTDNVEAYEHYLVAKGRIYAPIIGIEYFRRALWSIDAAIALDPKFAIAWSSKSNIHIILTIMGPADSANAERDAAIQAAQRAIGLEPNLADGYYQLSLSKFSEGNFIESELAYRTGTELESETLGVTTLMGIRYNAVGFFKKAHEIFKILRQSDPLNQVARGGNLLNFVFMGDIESAEEEYERGRELFGDDWYHGNSSITNIRLGYDDVTPDDIVFSIPVYDIVKEHLDSSENGLALLHKFYTNTDNLSSADFYYIAQCAAYFRDPEFAMDAIEKAVEIEAGGLFHIWLPVMKDVRQTPRFKEFVKQIGLVGYWEKFGWPDLCHPTDNGDFVCN